MTAKTYCERHATAYPADSGCGDCGALAMEAIVEVSRLLVKLRDG